MSNQIIQNAAQSLGCSLKLATELAQDFLTLCLEAEVVYQQCLDVWVLEDVVSLTHRLKAGIPIFFSEDLSELCLRVESHARSGDDAPTKELLEQFLRMLRLRRAELQEEVERSGPF